MVGPGRYEPDVTEGITREEDLPNPTVVRKSRSYRGYWDTRDTRGY